MRRSSLLGLAAALALFPAPHRAQVVLGLRAGYAFPTGEAAGIGGFGTFKERDLYGGAIPIQVEASWRFNPSFSAGPYLSYGFAWPGSQLKSVVCDQATSCTGLADIRVGAQAAWSFGLLGPVEPWIGFGAGWETAHFGARNASFPTGLPPPNDRTPPDKLEGSLRGWEISLQGGADWKASPSLAVGPFIQVQVGQYRVQDVRYLAPGTVPGNGGIPTVKSHQFVVVGARGKFEI